jgi:2-polyprenyl-6-methoxyphenol hydroxylase-like FAD-dependent oxidoreductase
MTRTVDVLIVGAGTTGLTLACDLQRRGVSYQLIDAADGPLPGSRAKALQPRSLEVLDDLGVLPELAPDTMLYPPIGRHDGSTLTPAVMYRRHENSEDVPHANTLLAAQYDTDAAFRRRLASLGGRVQQSSRLVALDVGPQASVATIDGPDGKRSLTATYVVGADGGSSATRSLIGVPFEGTTDELDRIIIADILVAGVSRDYWHIWPGDGGRRMSLIPLPDGTRFQLILPLAPDQQGGASPAELDELARHYTDDANVEVKEIFWSTVWRKNVRLARHFRVGPVFLAGDAAHVHPPTGGQGMNTGIQDAYNLGWKLAQVLIGAPEELLDTYEAERRPVAEGVLGRSLTLLDQDTADNAPVEKPARGEDERQLRLSYAGRGLAADDVVPISPVAGTALRAGDRAPDARFTDDSGREHRLHDLFRGWHFTVLAIGEEATDAGLEDVWPDRGAPLRVVRIPGDSASLTRIYGIDGPTLVLVRPDGYIAFIVTEGWRSALRAFSRRVAPIAADVP